MTRRRKLKARARRLSCNKTRRIFQIHRLKRAIAERRRGFMILRERLG